MDCPRGRRGIVDVHAGLSILSRTNAAVYKFNRMVGTTETRRISTTVTLVPMGFSRNKRHSGATRMSHVRQSGRLLA